MSLQIIELLISEAVIVSLMGLVGIARKKQGNSDQHHDQDFLRIALSFVDPYQTPITRKGAKCQK
jgi:hypothetical protein